MSPDDVPFPDGPRSSTVYGPVFSWRYGQSLGIDVLLVDSICSYRCVYCQLGRINRHSSTRGEWVPTDTILNDLLRSDWRIADVVTFSGSGEPTLASNLGDVIRATKVLTQKPAIVLTNGSTLGDPAVRADLCDADHVSVKFDAPDDELLGKINRPVAGVTVRSIIDGVRALRAQFSGRLSLQIMVLPISVDEASAFADVIREIGPDEIHVNVPSRSTPAAWALEFRGDHRTFEKDRAFRFLQREAVRNFSDRLHAATGLPVIPPPSV